MLERIEANLSGFVDDHGQEYKNEKAGRGRGFRPFHFFAAASYEAEEFQVLPQAY